MKAAKVFGWVALIGLFIFILSLIWGTCNTAIKMVANGQKVIYDEFKPEALLKKYEWFKDASAQLDAKVANVSAYATRYSDLKTAYGPDSLSRSKWSRDDRESWSQWKSEESGVKASYNDLAAQYNAAMVKFNYRFCNVGGLPQGTTQVLPKEYKPYITQ